MADFEIDKDKIQYKDDGTLDKDKIYTKEELEKKHGVGVTAKALITAAGFAYPYIKQGVDKLIEESRVQTNIKDSLQDTAEDVIKQKKESKALLKKTIVNVAELIADNAIESNMTPDGENEIVYYPVGQDAYKVTMVLCSGEVVNVKTANTYVKPDARTQVGSYAKGDIVTIIGKKFVNGSSLWYKLKDGSWICGDYIKIVETHCDTVKIKYVSVDGAKLYDEANPNSDSEPIDKGKRVVIVKSKKVGGITWYRTVTGQWIKKVHTDDKKPKTKKTDKGNPNKQKDPLKDKKANTGKSVDLHKMFVKKGKKIYQDHVGGTQETSEELDEIKKINNTPDTIQTTSSTDEPRAKTMALKLKTEEDGNKDKDKKKETKKVYDTTGGDSETDQLDYSNDYTSLKKDFKKIRKTLHLLEGTDVRYNFHHLFNRFKLPFPEYQLNKTIGYVFFTRPDLNIVKRSGDNLVILDELKKIPFYDEAYRNDKFAFRSLSDAFSVEHHFHPFLSNMVTSFDLVDEVLETTEVGETITGHKIVYGNTNIKSTTAGTFSCNFVDNKILDIARTIHLWVNYITDVKRGKIKPKDKYIHDKVLDYACSAYFFLCDATLDSRILFWAKFFGVFPTITPFSAFSWEKEKLLASPNYSINFAYSWQLPMHPLSIIEFNGLSKDETFEYRLAYNDNTGMMGATWVGAPFIEMCRMKNNNIYYYLRFRPGKGRNEK